MAGPIARAATCIALLLAGGSACAQVLPPHPPLRVLIVSDEVNPHALPPEQLTQPGDIRAALLAAPALHLAADAEAVREVPTDQVEDATTRLGAPRGSPAAYDVLVYFAHRIPNGVDGAAKQAAFVAALDDFLGAGGGLVSFHHGAYLTSGKEGVQALIGGQATGAVPWNAVDGQNVIAVAPQHFVAANEVEYPGTISYGDVARSVALANYPSFNNTPDERYPNFQLLAPSAEIELLFGSNYNEGGTTHVLGFVHRRPEWSGVVVAYQPGEYQPNALDDLAGNNFQILANAIYYARFHAQVELVFSDGFEGE